MAKTLDTDQGFTLVQTAVNTYHVTDNRKDKWGGLVSAHIFYNADGGFFFCTTFEGRCDMRSAELRDTFMMVVAKCLIEFPEVAA